MLFFVFFLPFLTVVGKNLKDPFEGRHTVTIFSVYQSSLLRPKIVLSFQCIILDNVNFSWLQSNYNHVKGSAHRSILWQRQNNFTCLESKPIFFIFILLSQPAALTNKLHIMLHGHYAPLTGPVESNDKTRFLNKVYRDLSVEESI